MKYDIILNEESGSDIGIAVSTRPSIPSPTRQYNEIEVKGKSGKLYEDLGTYADIDIIVKCNFVSSTPEEWNDVYRQVKRWIQSKSKLKFTDDLLYFYRINKITIDSTIRGLQIVGVFDLTINCKPHMYLESGLEEIPIVSSIYNNNEEARPTYKILGEGLLTLTVNGIAIKVNVGQNLIINTEKGLCYRIDGTPNNIALTGDYKDLYLKEGNNTFTWTSGFAITVVPNWRCL